MQEPSGFLSKTSNFLFGAIILELYNVGSHSY